MLTILAMRSDEEKTRSEASHQHINIDFRREASLRASLSHFLIFFFNLNIV